MKKISIVNLCIFTQLMPAKLKEFLQITCRLIAFEFDAWNSVPRQYFRSARGVVIWKAPD